MRQYYLFFLVFLRAVAFLASSPLMAVKGIPVLVKIGFAFVLSLVVFPNLKTGLYPLSDNALVYILQAAGEVLVGLELGLMASLVLYLFRMAGHFMDIHIGYGLANVFDSMTGAQNTVIAHFLYMFALVIYLSLDGHYSLIMALARSYELLPFNAVFSGGVSEVVLKAFAGMFTLAVQLAVPVMVVLLLTDTALGLVARMAPQMNIFVLGFPLKIVTGLLVLSVTLPLMATALSRFMSSIEKNLLLLLKGLS